MLLSVAYLIICWLSDAIILSVMTDDINIIN